MHAAAKGRARRRVAQRRSVALLTVLVRALASVRARRRAARLRGQVQALERTLAEQQAEAVVLTERLHLEARTDPLTGLGNRRRWQEQLAHELDRARRTGSGLAVAVVDLDRFKDVNDREGHAAGDLLLAQVAVAFGRAVRSVDAVARLGGEEFGIALPDAELEDAVQIVERVRTGLPGGMTCSAGLAMWDGHESAARVQARADSAMYRAKAAGRDRLVVD